MTEPQPDPDGDLERLRELLLTRDRQELAAQRDEVEALRKRIDELEGRYLQTPRRTTEVSEVLPGAIRHRRTTRDDLVTALQPDIERAVHDSIRRDPSVMADALYPVMGPAIRKLVLSLFSFDQLRAGARYKISHAYLIHRETSLPLAVHTPDSDDFEADMVSGMMEALRAFVQDSFDATDVDGLQDLRVGDVTLWIEWGPEAVLAVVVRGDAPQKLRLEMQTLLEAFHRDNGSRLALYDGQADAFEDMEPELAGLTDRLSDSPTTASRLKALLPLVALILVIIGIIILVVVLT